MKLKRFTAMLVLVAMMATMLVGCGNSGDDKTTDAGKQTQAGSATAGDQSTTEEETPLYNEGSLPIVNEPITLKVLMKDESGKAYAKVGDSEYWDWLTEKTGIQFEVESYSKEEMASKLPLIMATPDDMPDLFFNVGFTSADILNYGQNGQLLMLDDLLEQYGTNIKAAFDEVDGLYGGTIASDGHIYSIPRVAISPASVTYVINSRFMENAGLDPVKDEPKTIEDLYEVFKAIKASDANGDGTVGNEICWGGEPKTFKRYALSTVGISCYWPWEGCIFDDVDGEVYFVPTSEEYKYLLSWLQKFYAEGMIDQELFTQTSEQRTAKNKADLVFMNHTYDDPEKSTYEGRSGAFFPTVPISSAVSEPLIAIGSMYQPDMGAVSAYTEYPEICMLLLDYLYDDEASKVARYGLENVDYVIDSNGLTVSANPDSFSTGNGPTCLTTPSMGRQWMKQEETKLALTKREQVAEYGLMGWQNYLKFTDAESESINTLSADLGLYCDDFYVGVITGRYDLEKDWDAYVKACNDMGVDELIKVYQGAYNRFYGVE